MYNKEVLENLTQIAMDRISRHIKSDYRCPVDIKTGYTIDDITDTGFDLQLIVDISNLTPNALIKKLSTTDEVIKFSRNYEYGNQSVFKAEIEFPIINKSEDDVSLTLDLIDYSYEVLFFIDDNFVEVNSITRNLLT